MKFLIHLLVALAAIAPVSVTAAGQATSTRERQLKSKADDDDGGKGKVWSPTTSRHRKHRINASDFLPFARKLSACHSLETLMLLRFLDTSGQGQRQGQRILR